MREKARSHASDSGRVQSVIKRAAEDTETGYVQLFDPNQ